MILCTTGPQMLRVTISRQQLASNRAQLVWARRNGGQRTYLASQRPIVVFHEAIVLPFKRFWCDRGRRGRRDMCSHSPVVIVSRKITTPPACLCLSPSLLSSSSRDHDMVSHPQLGLSHSVLRCTQTYLPGNGLGAPHRRFKPHPLLTTGLNERPQLTSPRRHPFRHTRTPQSLVTTTQSP